MTLGWRVGQRPDLIYNAIIGPYNPKINTHNDLSVVIFKILVWRRAAGDYWPAGGSADGKIGYIIEIIGPNNPKIDTHNDVSVVF